MSIQRDSSAIFPAMEDINDGKSIAARIKEVIKRIVAAVRELLTKISKAIKDYRDNEFARFGFSDITVIRE